MLMLIPPLALWPIYLPKYISLYTHTNLSHPFFSTLSAPPTHPPPTQCYGRMKRMEEGKIANLLAQIGGPRNTPLGSDREGNLYWCYAGSEKLYVCSPSDRQSRNKGSSTASGPGLGPAVDNTTLRSSSPRTTASPVPSSSQVSRYLAVPPIHASLHNFGLMQPLIPPENISTKFLAAGRKYIHMGLEGRWSGTLPLFPFSLNTPRQQNITYVFFC